VQPGTQDREILKLELAADILRSFGELRFVARGASMIPAIFPGDVLLVRHQPLAAISRGDVALWSDNECFFAHRVLRLEHMREESAIVTCGDALREEDAPVTHREFLGHVYAILRRGKRIELARAPGLLSGGIASLARRSDFFSRWLLRYNSFLWAIAGRKNTLAQEKLKRPELLECS
jgi:signal peptidase I